tara:strand:- start:25222 stop:26106 length:885 start_codon:yes stop_codon:yes gene_type:complete
MDKNRKGIILAGGSGTRLYPLTVGISKQLLPVYDKPMIYYPLSVLMLANIKEILIISTPEDIDKYKLFLGNGSQFGIKIEYKIQPNPGGLAEAFLIGEEFIGNSNVTLVLGDNIFHGPGFDNYLRNASKRNEGATIFSYYVQDPERFGVVEFNNSGKAISIEEKPKKPRSNFAVTGLYFYDNEVVKIAKSINRSDRGELEISDINQVYLNNNHLNVETLGRGFAWFDSGTHDSLLDANQYIKAIENRQGFKVACLEEIAFNKKWIDKYSILDKIKLCGNNNYGEYLKKIIAPKK